MQTALVGTALLMGLAGGPHCVAMCGAACAGVIRIVRAPSGGGVAALPMPALSTSLAFHAGRLAGYAAGGAIAASAVQSLAFASEHVAALRPLWLLLHIFVFAWGVVLAVAGRQPLWAHALGRLAVSGLRPLAGSRWGVLATGALWLSMPCGLLYSALMLAALGNGALEGGVVMAAFAAGSGVSLLLAPWLLQRLRAGFGVARRAWGTRFAGAVLAAVALQAVWHDLSRQIAIWCQ
ncbi:MAG: sulfite exporter TauE/SafE family protein [Variovorax sp.]|nr:MAG: sulfite exporter TauE/SafE family protein [Variovorax sp.]